MRNRISDRRGARLSKRPAHVGLHVGLLVGVLSAVLFAAAPAVAVPSNKSECRRITRQIDHFEDVAMMAADRGDRMWYQSTTNHIDRLAARRVWLCPEYAEPDYAKIYAEWVAAVVKKAGQAFLQYLTFGAYSPGI